MYQGSMLHACTVRTTCVLVLLVAFCSAQQPAPEPAPAPGSAEDLVRQGEKLSREGKQDDALALYHQALSKSPRLYEAFLAAGVALDLKGNYADAQRHFTEAIDAAPGDSKQQAWRAMAFSYAFEGEGGKAETFEVQVLNARLAKGDWTGAAELCDELGRIYLESGDPDAAYKWYKEGFETAARKPDLSEADKNLWLFRWENAQARIAARQGKAAEAEQDVVAAKKALDGANNPDQARFYPYLTGYVAFYTGDYKTAIAELQKGDQHDPMVLALLGEAFEKSGDAVHAKDYYRKVLEIGSHNPANAFARPLAMKKLKGDM